MDDRGTLILGSLHIIYCYYQYCDYYDCYHHASLS